MWVRGLKLRRSSSSTGKFMSHPMWVRGLKQRIYEIITNNSTSHPMWVRGLKLYSCSASVMQCCRTLCGCVD